jgi:protoporphyrinogen oxidase
MGSDPVSAIAGAAGDLFKSVGNIWTSLNSVKIARQQTKQVTELTAQERIKYDELISSGNYTLASQLLQSKDNKESSGSKMVLIIIASTFLIVLVIIYLKVKQK